LTRNSLGSFRIGWFTHSHVGSRLRTQFTRWQFTPHTCTPRYGSRWIFSAVAFGYTPRSVGYALVPRVRSTVLHRLLHILHRFRLRYTRSFTPRSPFTHSSFCARFAFLRFTVSRSVARSHLYTTFYTRTCYLFGYTRFTLHGSTGCSASGCVRFCSPALLCASFSGSYYALLVQFSFSFTFVSFTLVRIVPLFGSRHVVAYFLWFVLSFTCGFLSFRFRSCAFGFIAFWVSLWFYLVA